jgi:CheY-like chemotaxis protein
MITKSTKNKRTVLVIEDDMLSYQVVNYRLQNMGYNVMHALTGQEAFKCMLEQKPDLILMDIYLPDINGCMLTRLIQSNGLNNIPVIAISSSDSQEDMKTAYKSGCKAYFVKPINIKAFTNQLQNILSH